MIERETFQWRGVRGLRRSRGPRPASGIHRSGVRGIFISMLGAVGVSGTGCGDSGDRSAELPGTMGESVLVEGRVREIDRTPMFVDGDGLIFVQSEKYGEIVILVPARERTCQASGLNRFASVQAADRIRVRGSVTGSRELTVCVEETHFLELLD
jgi:hypothetical protein